MRIFVESLIPAKTPNGPATNDCDTVRQRTDPNEGERRGILN